MANIIPENLLVSEHNNVFAFDGNLSETQSQQKEEILKSFEAKFVGRGVWNMFMTLVFDIDNFSHHNTLSKIKIIHFAFLLYCKNIYCGICREHASEFIKNNTIIENISNMCDKRMVFEYFKWFYLFRNSANKNNGITPPSYSDVIDYFNGDFIQQIPVSDFVYEKIENGVWHCLFILVTKCHELNHVHAIYYIICCYMKRLPYKQLNLYKTFVENHDFKVAFEDKCVENICIAFFDWLYALYRFINSRSDINVYDKDIIRDAYYNIGTCDKSCGL